MKLKRSKAAGAGSATLAALLCLAVAVPADAADTLPAQLADIAVGDPLSESPDCLAAKADARQWDERRGKAAMAGVGRFIIWPLGERSARRRKRAKNEARELIVDRVREACFTRPDLGRAPPISGQRRPMGEGYRGGAVFITGAGGYRIKGVVHPTLNTIYLTSLDGVVLDSTADDWALVASRVISPAGCRVAEVWAGPAKTWEASFVCPDGVVLRELVASQIDRVRLGAPLALRR